jgi:hypothetical protein
LGSNVTVTVQGRAPPFTSALRLSVLSAATGVVGTDEAQFPVPGESFVAAIPLAAMR